MKKITDFIKTSCAYTVIMLALLYIFGAIMQFENKGIVFAKFALVLLFGFVISAAAFLFKIKSLGKGWATLLHYAVLLLAFTVIFTWSGVLGTQSANVFSSFFIFTFFYVIGLLTVCISKYIRKKLESKNAPGESTKSTYKPRYDNFD